MSDHKGSYLRGEKTEGRDIDVMVMPDLLEPSDLAHYKTIVLQTPRGEKACGFICRREELAAWQKHEHSSF